MQLTVQRRLAGQLLKCSPKRVVFDQASLDTIKEAITKTDIRSLIKSGIIREEQSAGSSRGRIRKNLIQKSKGRQKGQGSRKGKANARLSLKESWINRVRKQRALAKSLRDKEMLSVDDFRLVYNKIKGGYFRNLRHVKLFIDERGLIKRK